MGLSLTAVVHAQDATDGDGTPAAAASDSGDEAAPEGEGEGGDPPAADPEPEPTPLEAAVATINEDGAVLWTCLAAFMVFFMQAGFALVEAGFTRAKNACNIIMKNAMDLSIGSLSFWVIGFALMFGACSITNDAGETTMDTYGWLGITEFCHTAPSPFGWAFILFQTMFCATAATIVSGAMAGRTKFVGYLAYSIAITIIVYPIFGKWAWGGLNGEVAKGWLERMDFYDFAGSTVVHSIGGWCALAGAIVIGPRIGKFTKEGKPLPIPGHNIPLAALGVFILWLGWFGFNAGSTTTFEGGSFAVIAFVTTMAASAGAVAAMIASWALFKKPDPSFTLNGALAGLVAITAGCDCIATPYAVLSGFVGGLIVVFAVIGLERCRIDDPVGAVSVHGICGAWGTIAVGLFKTLDADGAGGLLLGGGAAQLVAQLIGIVVAFAWAFPVSLAIFLLIKYTIGLRADEKEELEGLDISEHGMYAYPPAMLTDPMAGNVPSGAGGAAMVAAKPSVETT